jgi:hypothetical protein
MRPVAVKSSEQTICVSCIYDWELYISDQMACLLVGAGAKTHTGRVRTQSYGTRLRGKLAYSVAYDRSGGHSTGDAGSEYGCSSCPVVLKIPVCILILTHCSSKYMSHTHTHTRARPWIVREFQSMTTGNWVFRAQRVTLYSTKWPATN